MRGRGLGHVINSGLAAIVGVGAASLGIFMEARAASSPPLGEDVTGVAAASLSMSAGATGAFVPRVSGIGSATLTPTSAATGATYLSVTGTGATTLGLTGAAEGSQDGVGAAVLTLEAAATGAHYAPIYGPASATMSLTADAAGSFNPQIVGAVASTLTTAAVAIGTVGTVSTPDTLPTPTVTATPATLASVWPTLTGGEVLGLAPGSYTGLPTRSAPLASVVTITSTVANDLAAFPAGLKLTSNNNRNVTLHGLNLTLAAPATESAPGVYISGGSDNTVRECVLGGQIVSGKRWGYGVNAIGTTRLTLDRNRGETLKRGFSVQTITGLTVTDNDLFDIRVDSLDIGLTCRDVVVSGNHFRSGQSIGGDHADAIQFISTLTAASRDVVIENNLIEGSVANRPQGIFGGAKSGGLRLQNLIFRDNLLINTTFTGVGVVGADDLAIEDNVLLFVRDPDPLTVPTYSSIHTYAGTGVTASGNQATKFLLDATTTTSGNTVIAASTQGEADAAVTAWRAANR